MFKEYFASLVDLFFEFVQGKMISSVGESLTGVARFLLWAGIIGIVAMIIVGRKFFSFLDFSQLFSPIYIQVLDLTYTLAPIWAPIVFGVIFIKTWLRYIRLEYIAKEGSVLMEIKIPKETLKSPLAMEIFFTSMYQTGTATYIETFWKGKVKPWFSFELVSVEGQVKFFIWTPKKYRNLIEAQLYAQYPSIEIHEAEDYMAWLSHPDPVNWPMWSTYFKLTKPDVYPIKTYVDYGLDQDPKEEFKIDPMTSVLEFLGSMKKGEHIWIHIMIQAHRTMKLKDGYLFRKEDWKKAAKHEVEKIRKASVVEKKGSEFPGMPNPTKGQQNTIAALERSVSKFPFDACIRGAYVSSKEAFNPISITGLIGSFRQYSSNDDVNGFKLGWFTDFDYPWQDYKRKRRNRAEHEMLEAMKLRSFFQAPFKNFEGKPIILNTEELATIFHFPGSVAGTPGFVRLASKRVEPPGNLPI